MQKDEDDDEDDDDDDDDEIGDVSKVISAINMIGSRNGLREYARLRGKGVGGEAALRQVEKDMLHESHDASASANTSIGDSLRRQTEMGLEISRTEKATEQQQQAATGRRTSAPSGQQTPAETPAMSRPEGANIVTPRGMRANIQAPEPTNAGNHWGLSVRQSESWRYAT